MCCTQAIGISAGISIREFVGNRWVYGHSNKLSCVLPILLTLLLTDNK